MSMHRIILASSLVAFALFAGCRSNDSSKAPPPATKLPDTAASITHARLDDDRHVSVTIDSAGNPELAVSGNDGEARPASGVAARVEMDGGKTVPMHFDEQRNRMVAPMEGGRHGCRAVIAVSAANGTEVRLPLNLCAEREMRPGSMGPGGMGEHPMGPGGGPRAPMGPK